MDLAFSCKRLFLYELEPQIYFFDSGDDFDYICKRHRDSKSRANGTFCFEKGLAVDKPCFESFYIVLF